jgi:hypothetical protein
MRLLTTMVLLLLATFASAQQPSCDSVLLQRNMDSLGTSKQTTAAWLKLVTETNYDTMQREARASILAPFFQGSYRDFETKRRQYYEEIRYTSSEFEASQELRVALPSDAVAAWRDCMLHDATTLSAWIDDVSSDSVTLSVRWQPGLGLGSLSQVRVELIGAARGAALARLQRLDPGVQAFIVRRATVNGPIRGALNGRAGAPVAAFSTKFYVPSMPATGVPPPPCNQGGFAFTNPANDLQLNGPTTVAGVVRNTCDVETITFSYACWATDGPGPSWKPIPLSTISQPQPLFGEKDVRASFVWNTDPVPRGQSHCQLRATVVYPGKSVDNFLGFTTP